MVKEGVLENPKVDAIFGLHVLANVPAGTSAIAAARSWPPPTVRHRRSTAARRTARCPGAASTRSSSGAQIVTALQSIVSRNVDITRLPAVVTVGQFQSGVRNNIIPDTARLVGTIRTFDDAVQNDIHARVKRIAEDIAAALARPPRSRPSRDTPVTSTTRH